jgi:hypothetical protein
VDLVQGAAYQHYCPVGIQQGQVINPRLDSLPAGIKRETTGLFPAWQIQIHHINHMACKVTAIQDGLPDFAAV